MSSRMIGEHVRREKAEENGKGRIKRAVYPDFPVFFRLFPLISS
jgi:hypothetical protein